MKGQGEIHKSLMVVRDFNTPLSLIGKSSRQTSRYRKDIGNLNSIIHQLNLLDTYRTLPLNNSGISP